MFAVSFDLDTIVTKKSHPKSVRQAYLDIGVELKRYGFVWVQGSLYTTKDEDMANLFLAIQALKSLPWFPASIRDIRAFKIEQWSDFTSLVKT